MRGFEYVGRILSDGKDIIEPNFELPKRMTRHSMAYDVFSPESFVLNPNETYMLKTGIKAYMREDEGLILNVRSSMGKKGIVLSNTQAWIDCDFYNNKDNEGEIGLLFHNRGDLPWVVNINDRVAQAMFINYLVADGGNTDEERNGGFGSTNENK